MRGIGVLIIDDEADQLELMSLYLEKFDPDIAIETATSPREALEKIEWRAFDCIVLDNSMPEMTGLELAKKIRETHDTPIILYTGRGSKEIASQSTDYGVDDYLRKAPDPEHFETLARRIRRSVEKHELEELARTRFFPDSEAMRLPEYPKVTVKGKSIYILYEDGREEFWGEERSKSAAESFAKEIELGLKAIKYGKDYLAKALNDLMDELMGLGIPVEYIDNIIEKGYGDIRKLLVKLAQEKTFTEAQR
jgi:CheY-like chemotaxis protein